MCALYNKYPKGWGKRINDFWEDRHATQTTKETKRPLAPKCVKVGIDASGCLTGLLLYGNKEYIENFCTASEKIYQKRYWKIIPRLYLSNSELVLPFVYVYCTAFSQFLLDTTDCIKVSNTSSIAVKHADTTRPVVISQLFE
jgi:hypothetical protein